MNCEYVSKFFVWVWECVKEKIYPEDTCPYCNNKKSK